MAQWMQALSSSPGWLILLPDITRLTEIICISGMLYIHLHSHPHTYTEMIFKCKNHNAVQLAGCLPKPDVVVNAFNPKSWEAKASLYELEACSTE